ncbi:MAG: hypothetical protein ABIR28_06805 [Vicinamibacteria bacterium]
MSKTTSKVLIIAVVLLVVAVGISQGGGWLIHKVRVMHGLH